MTRTSRVAGAIAFASVCTVAGCATIVSGGKQDVSFTTTPPGAKVFVDDTLQGNTAMTLSLKRKHAPTNMEGPRPYQIRVELPGYKPYQLKLDANVNLW